MLQKRAASYEVISVLDIVVVVRGPNLISLIWAVSSSSPDQQNPLVRRTSWPVATCNQRVLADGYQ